jgi:hypothetical protein
MMVVVVNGLPHGPLELGEELHELGEQYVVFRRREKLRWHASCRIMKLLTITKLTRKVEGIFWYFARQETADAQKNAPKARVLQALLFWKGGGGVCAGGGGGVQV